jgi:hypothetical protein
MPRKLVKLLRKEGGEEMGKRKSRRGGDYSYIGVGDLNIKQMVYKTCL